MSHAVHKCLFQNVFDTKSNENWIEIIASLWLAERAGQLRHSWKLTNKKFTHEHTDFLYKGCLAISRLFSFKYCSWRKPGHTLTSTDNQMAIPGIFLIYFLFFFFLTDSLFHQKKKNSIAIPKYRSYCKSSIAFIVHTFLSDPWQVFYELFCPHFAFASYSALDKIVLNRRSMRTKKLN